MRTTPLFFLRSLQHLNEKYPTLFGADNDDDGGSEGNRSDDRAFGWLYNAEMVSKFEGISISEVWKLSPYNFLNDLVFLKRKAKLQEDEIKKLNAKYR